MQRPDEKATEHKEFDEDDRLFKEVVKESESLRKEYLWNQKSNTRSVFSEDLL